jgi:hypothetical protein
VIDAVVQAVAGNVERLHSAGRFADVDWWQEQHAWLVEHRNELE